MDSTASTESLAPNAKAKGKRAAAGKQTLRVRKKTHQSIGATEAASDGAITTRIAIAAYYLAEQRGFAPGHELDDWLAAERQVRGQRS